MPTPINRRQLGKRLLATTAFATLPDLAPAQISAHPHAPRHTASSGSWTEIHPGIWRCTVGAPEAITPVSSRLVPPLLAPLRTLPAVTTPPLAAPTAEHSPRGTIVTLPLEPHEELFGFGLQFFSVNHRGKKRTLRVNADPRGDTGDSHAPVPFFTSTRGYGLLADTARYATFYCGDARPKPTRTPAGSQRGGIEPVYTESLLAAEPSNVTIEVPVAAGVDLYLFAGPSMLDAVRRYNLFSGGGLLPPAWGLGFWYRASSASTDRYATVLATEFRQRNIPCDVWGLEPGWQTHAYSCTFVWNPTRFPDPGAFVKNLSAADFHVNLWEHAYTNPASPLFNPLLPLSGDMGVWGGLAPDFQDPRARRAFGDYHANTFLDLGVSGFKLDECDNSDYTGGWSFPELSRFPSGVDGEQMHSLFGLRYQHALWQPFLDRHQPTYQLVRSSGALAAPYPFVLYSDLYNHRDFIRALVNSGFSGLLWCPEVRDATSEEDLLRRLQSVVFSPLAMVNGWYIENPPWKQLDRKLNNANQLMPRWQDLEARCREIIGWRMQLVPYLRAAFARYATDGTPPFRALALDYPNISAFAKVDDAFLVGDRLLVAPLFADEPAGRTLTLPPGDWHDLWTGKLITRHTPGITLGFPKSARDAEDDSPQPRQEMAPETSLLTLTIPASARDIPVFIKADSVFPVAKVTNHTADPASHTLTVRIFGDGSLPFELSAPETPGAPAEHLVLSWDAATHTGSIQHSPNATYIVANWLPATAAHPQS